MTDKTTVRHEKQGSPKTAVITLIVCVLVGVFGIGGLKLNGVRGKVVRAFNDGETSIAADLAKHNENAYNVITVGRRVLGATDASVVAADAAYAYANSAATPSEMYAADLLLDGAINDLAAAMDTQDLSKTDADLVSAQIADMKSRDAIISHNTYNEGVTDYADRAGQFPASLIALLEGLGTPEYYR